MVITYVRYTEDDQSCKYRAAETRDWRGPSLGHYSLRGSSGKVTSTASRKAKKGRLTPAPPQ